MPRHLRPRPAHQPPARQNDGRDGDCDPHVIDMLAPEGQDQNVLLKDHACGPDGEPERMAVLPMILPGS